MPASRCHRRQTFVRLTQSLSFRNERIRRHFLNQKFFSGVETDSIEAYKFTSSTQKRTLKLLYFQNQFLLMYHHAFKTSENVPVFKENLMI